MLYKYDRNSLKYVRVKWVATTFKTIGVFVGLFIIMGLNINLKSKDNFTEEEIKVIIGRYNEFSEEKLIEEISKRNFKFPYIILAQAKLETSNFKSNIFIENHNLFGMREAVKRINVAKGTQHEHAYYDSWKESVEDYAYYCATYLSGLSTESEYYSYLSQNYAENKNYVQSVKDMVQKQDLKNKFNK